MRKGGRPKGLPKTGGRKPGVKNHVNEDLRALCQNYTVEGVEVIVSIMRGSDNDAARMTAVKELFERGWGKVSQPLSGDPEGPPIRFVIATGIDRPPNAA